MRFDQLSGWELMAVQVVALALLVATLWAVGAIFQRWRRARWMVMLLAPALGGALALGLLDAAESTVSSYLFAAVLFALGTVAMSVLLLAAIPGTRGAALGGLAFGGLLIVSFILTYYAVFTFGQPRWIRHPAGLHGGRLGAVHSPATTAVTDCGPGPSPVRRIDS